MKILITGGAGFIGSNIAIYLAGKFKEAQITCLDNLKRRGSELNLPRLKASNIIFQHGDIRNPEDIEAVGGFDILIECSAEPSVHSGYNGSPSYLINTNLNGTINCLEAVRKNNASIIFLSTSRVYSIKALREIPLIESDNRFELKEDRLVTGLSDKGISKEFSTESSRSLYGATKLCSELLIQEYISMYGILGVINRCGVVAGEWQMGKVDQGFMTLWVARHLYQNKPLSYIGFGGNGLQVRDVLNINDLCALISVQIQSMDKINGKTYNVGGGAQNSVSLRELTQKCSCITGNHLQINSVPDTNPFDIPYYVSDNTQITQELDWKPEFGIDDTIKKIHEWITDNYKELENVLCE